jgi:tRNA A-37 threonylcarbamoyl transferase component Bud32
MPTVYVLGQPLHLLTQKRIDKGGEAYIYDLGNGRVAKLLKRPSDPEYASSRGAQEGARQRALEYKSKLAAFPNGLPTEIVAPVEPVYSDEKQRLVIGYTMPYIRDAEQLKRYRDQRYRKQESVDGNQVIGLFEQLHSLVQALHAADVVIGDFNDANVLVASKRVFLVDTDSMQFSGFVCRGFTARFLDPLCSEPTQLELKHLHNKGSDWYAFSNMLFQSLLCVGPYDGLHRPKTGPRLQHNPRVLQRLTIFSKEVVYPPPAIPYHLLPDELLEYFHRLYEQDVRGVFPRVLLENTRWTKCTKCRMVHARPRCPSCATPSPTAKRQPAQGSVATTQVFQTKGRLLSVAFQGKKLRYLYHEDGVLKREDGSRLAYGSLNPDYRCMICEDITIVAEGNTVGVLTPHAEPKKIMAETYRQKPMIDTNAHHYYWIQNNQLLRSSRAGPEALGNVPGGRTAFWVGERFGLGFFRPSQSAQYIALFVFSHDKHGLNDQVKLPTLTGDLKRIRCFISSQLAWLFITLNIQGRIESHCYVIDEHGSVVAQAVRKPEGHWLTSGLHGRFAAGKSLFGPTDNGIVRITPDNGSLRVTHTFPGTAPFVNRDSTLRPGDGGIHVVSKDMSEIAFLTIK